LGTWGLRDLGTWGLGEGESGRMELRRMAIWSLSEVEGRDNTSKLRKSKTRSLREAEGINCIREWFNPKSKILPDERLL